MRNAAPAKTKWRNWYVNEQLRRRLDAGFSAATGIKTAGLGSISPQKLRLMPPPHITPSHSGATTDTSSGSIRRRCNALASQQRRPNLRPARFYALAEGNQ